MSSMRADLGLPQSTAALFLGIEGDVLSQNQEPVIIDI